MPSAFISYRRENTRDIVGRLFDRLQSAKGWNSIFVDVDSITGGTDFADHIAQSLRECQVLLIIIGKNWVGDDGSGKRRIDSPHDLVRIELETALRNGMCVIPVLVHGAAIPARCELPETLCELSGRNAVILDSGADFHLHVDRLIRHIDQQVNSAAYDAVQRFKARSEVTGHVHVKMLTKDGQLISTSDGRSYSVGEPYRPNCSQWKKQEAFELVLMLHNVTREEWVAVTEMLTIDATKTDVQMAWPLRLDQELGIDRELHEAATDEQDASNTQPRSQEILLSRRELAKWNEQFPDDKWAPFDAKTRDIKLGCLLHSNGPQFVGVQELNVCLKNGYRVERIEEDGAFMNTRYDAPNGNRFTDFTGGVVKVTLSRDNRKKMNATKKKSTQSEERVIRVGLHSDGDDMQFFGVEEIDTRLSDGYTFVSVEEGGLLMRTRYEGADGTRAGNFTGAWVNAILVKP